MELRKNNKSLMRLNTQLQSKLNAATKQNYDDKKFAQSDAIQEDKMHRGEMDKKQQKHDMELSKVYSEVERANSKAALADTARIATELKCRDKLREERHRMEIIIESMKAKHLREVGELRQIIDLLHQHWWIDQHKFNLNQDNIIHNSHAMIERMNSKVDAKQE